jgi:transcriptional regulator with XRE-family HTH domain
VSKSAKTAPPAPTELVARLNQMRLEQDLSYSALGTAIGLDPAALHRILRGREQPWDRTLFKIQRFLERADETPARAKRRARRVA